jgi:hypothetical protein
MANKFSNKKTKIEKEGTTYKTKEAAVNCLFALNHKQN